MGDDASFTFDDLSDDSPSLAGIYAASVQGRVAMGERAGSRVFRIGAADDAPWVTSSAPLQAYLDGFDLHAAVAFGAEDRDRLERLCRYVLRPTVAEKRVELREDGKVLLELKNPFRDGTTHLFFEPLFCPSVIWRRHHVACPPSPSFLGLWRMNDIRNRSSAEALA